MADETERSLRPIAATQPATARREEAVRAGGEVRVSVAVVEELGIPLEFWNNREWRAKPGG
jgi:hypothetical protein